MEGYSKDEDNGSKALARTQVYLSKTKLVKYKQVSSSLYTKSTRRMVTSLWSGVEL